MKLEKGVHSCRNVECIAAAFEHPCHEVGCLQCLSLYELKMDEPEFKPIGYYGKLAVSSHDLKMQRLCTGIVYDDYDYHREMKKPNNSTKMLGTVIGLGLGLVGAAIFFALYYLAYQIWFFGAE